MANTRTTKAPLVGRSRELQLLGTQIDAVASGSSRVVLLLGDAGIGKTQLAKHVVMACQARGFIALQGRGHSLHQQLAYAPIVEALSPIMSGDDPRVSTSSLFGLPGRAELGRLFPGLGGELIHPLGDPALERVRLFEAVARLLGRIASRSSAVMWLDDVHWADATTIELLQYVCGAEDSRRLLLLLTCRSGEVEGPLADLMTSLRRDDRCVEVHLAPLSSAEVAEQIRTILSADPPPELLDAVVSRAGGVPLFVAALVHELISARQVRRGAATWMVAPRALTSLPPVVHDVVAERLGRLDDDERRLFELIAVAGTSASADVLTEILGEEWDRPLRGLLVARLLVERPTSEGVGYEALHPLYTEVAYARLTESQRRRSHAAVARALDRFRPDDVVALAPHFRGASGLVDPYRSLSVLAAAGKRALVLHADAEACRYLGEATSRAEELGRTVLLPDLLEALGTARERCGDLDGAAVVWQAALGALVGENSAATPRLHNRLALLEWERGNLELSRLHLHEVAAAGLPLEDALDQQLLWLIVLARSGDKEVTIKAFEQVESLVQQFPSAQARAVGHIARASLAQMRRDYAVARTEGERALALLDVSDPVYLVGGPHRQISLAATAAGDVVAGMTHAVLAVKAAHEGGLPSIECASRINLAVAQFLAGEWSAAESELRQAVQLGRRAMSPRAVAGALVWQGFLRSHRGALESARSCLAEAERLYPMTADQHIHGDLAVVRATLDRIAGRRPGALDVDIPSTGARYALVLPLLGEALLAGGDRPGATAIAAQLHRTAGSPLLPRAFADRLDGLLGEDEVALTRARQGFSHLGMPFEAARAMLEVSELVLDVHQLAAAVTVFDRLGAKPWSDRGRRLLRSHGVRPPPAPREDGALSPREAEVARLAADGLSNAEIAARLYVGVRTVETHLRKAYARLGLGSRVALARWVTEQADGEHDLSAVP